MALQQHYILLQCFPLMLLGSAVHAYSVSIHPRWPFVELGSDVHLSCSTDCPGGQPSWVTQDDSDFTTTEVKQGNILSILSVHEYHAGRYDCTSQCKQQHKRASARLNVFSFPDPVLSVDPVDPVSGQPVQVTCTVSAVYSSSQYRLDIKLFGKNPLNGSTDEFCNESSFCNYILSATDQRGGERIDYTCLADLTVSEHNISKTANATLRFQDTVAVDSKQETTPAMSSLTSSAAALVETTTITPHMETAISTESMYPYTTLDTVSSNGQITSSQFIRSSPREVGIVRRFTTSVVGSPTQTYDYREDSNAVESHTVKSVENVRRHTTSICITGALLFFVLGIGAYVYKYGRKPLCLGGSKRKDRKESTNDLKELP